MRLGRVGLLSSVALFGCGGEVLPRRVTSRGLITEPLTVVDANSGLASYRREGARLPPGASIQLEAIDIWRPLDTPVDEIATEELQALSYELREAIGAVLEKEFTVVRVPAPYTLKAHCALAEGVSPWIVFEHLGTNRLQGGLFEDEASPSSALQALLARARFQTVLFGGKTREEILAVGQMPVLPPRQPGAELTWKEIRQACAHLATQMRESLLRERAAAPGEGSGP